jgi:hypothetical protein
MNMTLTSEEIALIEQKREEKRLMELELKKSYDIYKQRRIESEQKTCENIKNQAEKLKSVYLSQFNELIKVSKDFSFECEKIQHDRRIDLYELDDEGYELRSKVKEVIKTKTYSYNLKIKYTGEVPEGHNYFVAMVDQYSKYSGSLKGYKMQVQGTGISTWDKRGQMTNPKSVVQRLVEHVESQFRQIEYRDEAKQRSKRIEDRFKLEYSKFVDKTVINVNNNEFIVTFENDIRITFYGYEDGEGNIHFNNPKISTPYNKIDMKSLLDALSNVKGGN